MTVRSGASRRRRRDTGLSFPLPARNGGPAQSWIEPEDIANIILDGNEITINLPDQTSNNDPLLIVKSGAAYPRLFHAILLGKAIARSGGSDYGYFRTTRNTAEFTFVLVVRVTTPVNSVAIIDFQVAGGQLQQNTVNGGFKYNQANGGSIPAIAGTMANWNTIVLMAKQSTSNMTVRINGVQQASFVPHPNLWLNATTDFCKSNTSVMELAAFGKYNSVLSLADILDVEGYLKKRFKHYQ